MLTTAELQEIADEMYAAQLQGRQIAPFSTRCADFDLFAAYAAGQLIHQARLAGGAHPVGRKIGFTNPEMWAPYGVRAPIWSYLYDYSVSDLPTGGGSCRLAGLCEAKIEPEIVLHVHTPPPPGADLPAIAAAIDWVAHGFEIVQSHFPGWRFAATDTVVDGGLHAALLLGPRLPLGALAADPLAALEHFSLTLLRDGRQQAMGRGANVLGGPLQALRHLLASLGETPEQPPLQAGEMVSTGTITAAMPVQAGETWHTTLDGIALPGLTVRFTP